MKIYFVFSFLTFIFIKGEKHEVIDLFDGLYTEKIYSGYLETNEPGNELFYIYMPSQNGDEEKNNEPLLLWLNGGPGCSSLIGMLTEIGPVVSNLYSDKWTQNEYAWNKNLNVLFIENPAGVGFTKANKNITYSEIKTAKNLHEALNNFFEEFEHLKKRDFYITGESYAGVYIPYLTEELINTNSTINLKGILIGNPMTSYTFDYDRSTPDFALSHGLIDLDTYLNFSQNCPCVKPERAFIEYFGLEDYETKCNISIEDNSNEFISYKVTKKCNEIRQKISDLIYGIDIYGIYRKCKHNNNKNIQNNYKSFILKQLSKYKHNNIFMDDIDSSESDSLENEIDIIQKNICDDDLFIDDFLNNKKIKEKLNVNLNKTWKQCANLNYSISESIDFYKSYLPKINNTIKVWIMSGDTDIIMSTLGTKRWIYSLNSKVKNDWEPYFDHENQICGFKITYENGLTLITAKGAGHMLPQDKPKIAEIILNLFIESKINNN